MNNKFLLSSLKKKKRWETTTFVRYMMINLYEWVKYIGCYFLKLFSFFSIYFTFLCGRIFLTKFFPHSPFLFLLILFSIIFCKKKVHGYSLEFAMKSLDVKTCSAKQHPIRSLSCLVKFSFFISNVFLNTNKILKHMLNWFDHFPINNRWFRTE